MSGKFEERTFIGHNFVMVCFSQVSSYEKRLTKIWGSIKTMRNLSNIGDITSYLVMLCYWVYYDRWVYTVMAQGLNLFPFTCIYHLDEQMQFLVYWFFSWYHSFKEILDRWIPKPNIKISIPNRTLVRLILIPDIYFSNLISSTSSITTTTTSTPPNPNQHHKLIIIICITTTTTTI